MVKLFQYYFLTYLPSTVRYELVRQWIWVQSIPAYVPIVNQTKFGTQRWIFHTRPVAGAARSPVDVMCSLLQIQVFPDEGWEQVFIFSILFLPVSVMSTYWLPVMERWNYFHSSGMNNSPFWVKAHIYIQNCSAIDNSTIIISNMETIIYDNLIFRSFCHRTCTLLTISLTTTTE